MSCCIHKSWCCYLQLAEAWISCSRPQVPKYSTNTKSLALSCHRQLYPILKKIEFEAFISRGQATVFSCSSYPNLYSYFSDKVFRGLYHGSQKHQGMVILIQKTFHFWNCSAIYFSRSEVMATACSHVPLEQEFVTSSGLFLDLRLPPFHPSEVAVSFFFLILVLKFFYRQPRSYLFWTSSSHFYLVQH